MHSAQERTGEKHHLSRLEGKGHACEGLYPGSVSDKAGQELAKEASWRLEWKEKHLSLVRGTKMIEECRSVVSGQDCPIQRCSEGAEFCRGMLSGLGFLGDDASANTSHRLR